jgi:hypothetical protein
VRRIENQWVAGKFNAAAGFNGNGDTARSSKNDIAAAAAGGGAPLKVRGLLCVAPPR